MERDFLGLGSKESSAGAKEEGNTDNYKEIGLNKGPGMQWSFSNKVSAVPQFMPFMAAQEDKGKKIASDSLFPPGFVPVIADTYDANQKRSAAEFQKSCNHGRQGGTHLSVTAYSMQPDMHRPHDVKMVPVFNRGNSVSPSNPFFKNYFTTCAQNFAGAVLKPQLLGGINVVTPQSNLPTFGSLGGITERWNSVTPSKAPAQLTIFYAGAVNIYDNISPEKAQAIMLLAGNGSSITSNAPNAKVQVQEPGLKSGGNDSVALNQLTNTPPGSVLSSPLSVSSHTGPQSGSGSTCTDEFMATKSAAAAATPTSKIDPPKIVNAMGSGAATTMIPSAVPQARKASLARFLEKRKERAMNAGPYNLNKAPTESNIINFAATSAAGTGSLTSS